jgi:hypothetical protein
LRVSGFFDAASSFFAPQFITARRPDVGFSGGSGQASDCVARRGELADVDLSVLPW